jgi:hypothetical protein
MDVRNFNASQSSCLAAKVQGSPDQGIKSVCEFAGGAVRTGLSMVPAMASMAWPWLSDLMILLGFRQISGYITGSKIR